MSDDRSEASIGTSLLVRVRALEPDAWRRLVRIYGPVVYRWCIGAGVRGEDAADVGQEVFRAVADGIANFRRERPADTFVGWLRTITRHKIADLRRRQATDPEAVGGTDFQLRISQLPDTHDPLDDEPDAQQVHSLLFHRALEILQSEFEPRTWQAFWATAIENRPTEDVARDLDMTTLAVRKAKSRVLRRLRNEFNEGMDER
jgi:RNA polymerase sigma-70 factor (ECF subfamily)